jgi:hypothetical protein
MVEGPFTRLKHLPSKEMLSAMNKKSLNLEELDLSYYVP